MSPHNAFLSVGIAAALAAPAHGIVTVIDDLDPGYSTSGSWSSQAIGGRYNGDWQYQNTAGGNEAATWGFSGLASGKYVLSATTFTQGNLSTSATYTVTDGGPVHTRNQQVATNHFDIDAGGNAGITFARISAAANAIIPVTVTDGNLAVSLTDNDAGLFLVADAVRLESVRSDVDRIYIIGNGEAGYSESGGSWLTWGGDVGDHAADFRYSSTGTVSDLITVSFTGIDPGTYRISTAWTAGGNRTQSATLAYSTPGGSGTTTFSQRPGAAADDTFEEVNWQDMFTNVTVTGSSLTLTLANNNTGPAELLIADAFRLERLTIPEPGTGALMALAMMGILRRRR